MEKLWHSKDAPTLANIKSPATKFKKVTTYLEIDNILCVVPDFTKFSVPPPYGSKFYVTDIKGPRASYIKNLLQEWIPNFSTSLHKYVKSQTDYDEITEVLQKMKKECEELIDKNNYHNKLKFKGDFDFYVSFKNQIVPIPTFHLDLSPSVQEQLIDHLNLRMNFFIELLKMVNETLFTHLTPVKEIGSQLKWNSEHAELEIAELLESLVLTHRIEFDKSPMSSAKFYRELYLLFGIDNVRHHQKLQQIRKRISQPSYLHELAKAIEKDIVKVKRKTKK